MSHPRRQILNNTAVKTSNLAFSASTTTVKGAKPDCSRQTHCVLQTESVFSFTAEASF